MAVVAVVRRQGSSTYFEEAPLSAVVSTMLIRRPTLDAGIYDFQRRPEPLCDRI